MMMFSDELKPVSDVQTLVEHILLDIQKLPPDELAYYLTLLVAVIYNEPEPERHLLLLMELDCLVNALIKPVDLTQPSQILGQMNNAYDRLNNLLTLAQLNTLSWTIKKTVLNFSAVMCSGLAGLVGFVAGLVTGACSQWNFIKGGALGALAGLGIGLTIGFRIPGKLALDPFTAKIEFVLNSIVRQLEARVRTQNNIGLDYRRFEEETKQYILDVYFQDALDKEAAFTEFLRSEQSYQICTTQSGFVDRALKGSIGNHVLIRYKINGIVDTPIEFGARKRTPNFVDQAESPRIVNGQKLFEMLVLDRVLQQNHQMNWAFVFEAYQAGDNDCLTYIDKILIGTRQQPTKVTRFVERTDTWVGRHIVGHLFGFFNKTASNELESIGPYLTDGNQPKVCTYLREERGSCSFRF